MTDKIKMKVDGCTIEGTITDTGMKVKTSGKNCKKVLKKDYFKKMEMDFPD